MRHRRRGEVVHRDIVRHAPAEDGLDHQKKQQSEGDREKDVPLRILHVIGHRDDEFHPDEEPECDGGIFHEAAQSSDLRKGRVRIGDRCPRSRLCHAEDPEDQHGPDQQDDDDILDPGKEIHPEPVHDKEQKQDPHCDDPIVHAVEEELLHDHGAHRDLGTGREDHGDDVGRRVPHQGEERADPGQQVLTGSPVALWHQAVKLRVGKTNKAVEHHDHRHGDQEPAPGKPDAGPERNQTAGRNDEPDTHSHGASKAQFFGIHSR